MHIAIVVDDLIQKGGQEDLLVAVSEIWPDAPIFTSQASQYWKEFFTKRHVQVITSFMERLPFAEKLNRYYSPFLSHILAFEKFDLSEYDIVLSISSRYAHFVSCKPTSLHICYMNSPARMFWEPFDYFSNEGFGFLKPFKNLAKSFLNLPLSYLRTADYISAQKIDRIVANSINSQKRVAKYYNRESSVIYPFVHTADFSNDKSGNYFALITRLISWKRVDIAVKACTKLGLKLKIIGVGPDLERLEKLAGPTVEFLGYARDDKSNVLKNAAALIQTQQEDFGIVPLEAMASGKPVIAFGKGGVLETVTNGVTGVFFDAQTSESLEKVLNSFDADTFSPNKCRERAELFDISIFKNKLKNFVQDRYKESIV